MKEKKGFATAVFAGMVVLALAFLASSLLVRNSGFQNTQLQARLVFERFQDAKGFLNSTLDDAILDSAYAAGCGDNLAGFCTELGSRYSVSNYLKEAGVLNDSLVTVYFVPTATCTGTGPPFSVSENGWLSANYSQVSFKNEKLALSKSVAVTQHRNADGKVESVSISVDGDYSFSQAACQ